jgi:hypothetical protein
MKIKDLTKNELETLSPDQLAIVYDLILSLKEKPTMTGNTQGSSYLAVRKALSKCKGSLSEDIISLREDRL